MGMNEDLCRSLRSKVWANLIVPSFTEREEGYNCAIRSAHDMIRGTYKYANDPSLSLEKEFNMFKERLLNKKRKSNSNNNKGYNEGINDAIKSIALTYESYRSRKDTTKQAKYYENLDRTINAKTSKPYKNSNSEYKKEIVDNTSILDYCAAIGFDLVYKNHNYKHPGWNGLTISEDGKAFYDFSESCSEIKKGKTIMFVRWLHEVETGNQLSHQEAINEIIQLFKDPVQKHGKSFDHYDHFQVQKTKQNSTHKVQPWELPPRASSYARMFAYLVKTRKIDAEIIRHAINAKILYESAEKSKQKDRFNHNCVFVCRDENGAAKSVFLRSTLEHSSFKQMRGDDTHYSWIYQNGTSNTIRIFESPVDLMSRLTIYKAYHPEKYERFKNDTWIALNGLKHEKVLKLLEQNQAIDQIVICTDDDPINKYGISPGNKFAEDLKNEINEKWENKYAFYRDKPTSGKDWNETLCALKNQQNKEDLSFHQTQQIQNDGR